MLLVTVAYGDHLQIISLATIPLSLLSCLCSFGSGRNFFNGEEVMSTLVTTLVTKFLSFTVSLQMSDIIESSRSVRYGDLESRHLTLGSSILCVRERRITDANFLLKQILGLLWMLPNGASRLSCRSVLAIQHRRALEVHRIALQHDFSILSHRDGDFAAVRRISGFLPFLVVNILRSSAFLKVPACYCAACLGLGRDFSAHCCQYSSCRCGHVQALPPV